MQGRPHAHLRARRCPVDPFGAVEPEPEPRVEGARLCVALEHPERDVVPRPGSSSAAAASTSAAADARMPVRRVDVGRGDLRGALAGIVVARGQRRGAEAGDLALLPPRPPARTRAGAAAARAPRARTPRGAATDSSPSSCAETNPWYAACHARTWTVAMAGASSTRRCSDHRAILVPVGAEQIGRQLDQRRHRQADDVVVVAGDAPRRAPLRGPGSRSRPARPPIRRSPTYQSISASLSSRKRTVVQTDALRSRPPPTAAMPDQTWWSRPDSSAIIARAAAASRGLAVDAVAEHDLRVDAEHEVALHADRPGLAQGVLDHDPLGVALASSSTSAGTTSNATPSCSRIARRCGEREARIKALGRRSRSRGWPTRGGRSRAPGWSAPRARSRRGSSRAPPRRGSSRRSAGAPP